MGTETVDALIQGGKASAAPPLGPALGPLGVNIGQVVQEINRKTESFKGMQVPVKITVDTDTKEFSISVGTPPCSALIKKEAGIQKGASNPLSDKVADLKIEQIIKISKMKEDALLGKNNFSRVKEILGTCDSMGVLVEGKPARETIQDINKGAFKEKIEQGKTELTAEELKAQEAERKRLEEEMKKKMAEYESRAKQILDKLEGKPRGAIKTALLDAKIPSAMVEKLLPTETAVDAGAAKGNDAEKPAAKPAAKKK